MKTVLLLVTFLYLKPGVSLANDICAEESEIVKIAKSISYPNCLKAKIVSDFQMGSTDALCKGCKSSFEMIFNNRVKENPSNLQEDFFKASIYEYKKNLINNVINAVKLRSLEKSKGQTPLMPI